MERPTPWIRSCGRALLGAALPLACLAPGARAQDGPPEGWPLRDNSFFIEEAFNQDAGIFQSTLMAIRWRDDPEDRWEAQFEQEWPVGSMRHQLSFAIPFAWVDDAAQDGLEDVQLGYRYQVLEETDMRPAFAPRLSVLLPTADEEDAQGSGEFGWEVNLPLSKAVGDVYLHLNVGSRSRPDVEPATECGECEYLTTPFVGGGAFLRLHPRFNLMLETLAEFEERVSGPTETERDTRWILSPGLRAGWTAGERTFVLGAAVPLGLTDTAEDVGFLGYLSLELPF